MNIISGIGESGFLAHSAFSAGIATKDSNGNDITATYLTGVDLTPYQTTAGMTAYANSAEVTGTAQYGLTTAGWSEITGGGGGVTGDFELKEGNGIQLTDDPTAHTTTISVSGDYATNTQLQTVSGEITALIPSTAGLATEDFVTSQGYITNDAITGKQDITGMTAYATVESLTAKQDAGDYLSATDSASFLLTSDSGNFYPMNENPAGYLTAHQSLADYQTTAGMTAYMTTGDSAEFMTTAERSDYIPTGVSSEFYTTANTANYISGVPAGTMNESAFSYDASDNITAYNGSAFKAGDEFPQSATEAIETVTANSADWNGTTETVSSNSGVWGGSALPVSAGKGVKISLQNDTLVFSNDETLLWSGSDTQEIYSFNYQLNESLYNFEKIEAYVKGTCVPIQKFVVSEISATNGYFNTYYISMENVTSTGAMYFFTTPWTVANNGTVVSAANRSCGVAFLLSDGSVVPFTGNGTAPLYKIVGINRTAGE